MQIRMFILLGLGMFFVNNYAVRAAASREGCSEDAEAVALWTCPNCIYKNSYGDRDCKNCDFTLNDCRCSKCPKRLPLKVAVSLGMSNVVQELIDKGELVDYEILSTAIFYFSGSSHKHCFEIICMFIEKVKADGGNVRTFVGRALQNVLLYRDMSREMKAFLFDAACEGLSRSQKSQGCNRPFGNRPVAALGCHEDHVICQSCWPGYGGKCPICGARMTDSNHACLGLIPEPEYSRDLTPTFDDQLMASIFRRRKSEVGELSDIDEGDEG